MRRSSGVHKSRASSTKLRMGGTRRSRNAADLPVLESRTMGPRAIEENRARQREEMRARLNAMDFGERATLSHLQNLANEESAELPPPVINLGGVLDGSERFDISHAGGEFEEALADEVRAESRPKRYDWRIRTDQTERRNLAFQSQMSGMTDAYISYCAQRELRGRPQNEEWEDIANVGVDMRPGDAPAVEEVYEIKVVDMFETKQIDVKVEMRGTTSAAALVAVGLIPCAPYTPHVAFVTRVLEAYRSLHTRCPQLAIHAYVKALCDQHGVEFAPYLRQQFSIAYDVYLEIRRRTDARVMSALGRDESWRLKHACPACTYKLEGEDRLIFDMLTTMDGNDSLKRVLRRSKVDDDSDETEPTLGASKERADNRDAGDGYFLSRAKVEEWSKARLAQILPTEANSDEDNPCADRWKNMINDVTSKMWGIFDETGIFLALCRHGFVLVIADMIRSGELAKYPLAVVKTLLDVFGLNLGAGYDVACHFGTTVNNSELGPQAREQNLRCLVGSFHGHAHNRLCQLNFLATYVKGLGLEDLEGCERYFSRSNGLAKSCRYSSRFHRQQEISTFAKQIDTVETYANLSKFLCSNYKQALDILKTEPALRDWMRREKVDGTERFHEWLAEEKVYLVGLKDAAKLSVETLEMEYVRKLTSLTQSAAKHNELLGVARRARADDGDYVPGVRKEDVARRHAKERVDRDRESVRELERLLEITEPWTNSSPKWAETITAIKTQTYLAALNALELLVVERIFELTKMNRSQTGYKMRTHIAKALQARSKAVRNAIDRYNAAASELAPPKPSVNWEQVVSYAFLGDFDLLRDTDGASEALDRPWTRPAYRLSMDSYFKTLRAKEEIKRLDVEIPRVVAWIRDETRVLREKEKELRVMDGKTAEEVERDHGLALQVKLYRERRGRYDAGHMKRFRKLAETPGFKGSLRPGRSVEAVAARRAARAAARSTDLELLRRLNGDSDEEMEDVEDPPPTPPSRTPAREPLDEDDEGDDAREERVGYLVYQISRLGMDDGVRPRLEQDS